MLGHKLCLCSHNDCIPSQWLHPVAMRSVFCWVLLMRCCWGMQTRWPLLVRNFLSILVWALCALMFQHCMLCKVCSAALVMHHTSRLCPSHGDCKAASFMPSHGHATSCKIWWHCYQLEHMQLYIVLDCFLRVVDKACLACSPWRNQQIQMPMPPSATCCSICQI